MKAVIFDLDGTVLDSAPGIIGSLTYAIRQLGHDFHPFEGIERLLGPPMNEVVAQLLGPFGDNRIADCVEHYRAHYGQYGLYQSQPYQGMAKAMRILSSHGYSLYVATSKRKEFAEKILAHTGLRDIFQSVYGTSPDGALDDKVCLLKVLLNSFKIRPSSICMIGDKRDDMIAARKHSILPVGVLWGYGTATELQESGAHVLVESPEKLPAAISALDGG